MNTGSPQIASPSILVEAIPQMAWVTSERGGVREFNQRWTRYFGGESGRRRTWLTKTFVHPEDLAEAIEAWRASLESGGDLEVELRLRRLDGAYRWHIARAAAVRDASGAVESWVGTCTDIEVRKQVEWELEYQRSMFEALGEALLDGLLVVSPDRRLVWTNSRCREMWGIDEDEFPVGGDMRIAAARSAELVVDKESHLRQIDRMYAEQYGVLRDDIELTDGRFIERFSAPITTGSGEFLGRVNSFHDVTDRMQLVIAVRQQARAALALSTISDAVFVVDLDGVLTMWNPAAVSMTGLDESSVVGMPIDEALPAWQVIADRVPICGVAEPRLTPVTMPLGLTSGELWVSAIGVRFPEGVVFTLRDVTDDQRLERLRTEIIATVSHELRTPLTSIYGMAVTLQRPRWEVDSDTRRQLLDLIVEQASRLNDLIEDILIASHVEAGVTSISVEAVDVLQVVADVVAAARSNLPENISLRVDCVRDSLCAVADVHRLRQVVGNLVDNAIKYSPDGGEVRIHVHGDASAAWIDVEDHGIGIPRRELPHVFEKFYRLDPSMTRGIPGTGLGLYIASELTRRMGGNLAAHSQFGVGSTFTLQLTVPGKQETRYPPARAHAGN